MKHIYLFNESSRGGNYGIGTYVNQMVENLTVIPNLSVNVVHIFSDKEIYTQERKENCLIHYMPDSSVQELEKCDRYFRNVWYLLKFYIKIDSIDDSLYFHLNFSCESVLVKLIKNDYPQSVILYTIHYQSWAFCLYGNTEKFKSIVNCAENYVKTDRFSKVVDSFVKERLFYNNVDRLICISEFTYKIVNEVYGISDDKLFYLPNNLSDKGEIITNIEKQVLKKRMLFNVSDKIILFVGRLDKIKGLEFLIKAFCAILEEDENYHLIIVGDGDYDRYLKLCSRFMSKISFTGFISRNKLYDYYKIADVGVMPSMHEQCSFVAIEMMMFGIPMIISNTTGLNEMIDDDRYKINVKYDGDNVFIDYNEIKGKIIDIISTKENVSNKNRLMFRCKYNKFDKKNMPYRDV